ncbi:four helix bundle protein [Flavobacterium sp. ASW18X]|uniref:four helix bundle protein n=1 Tax=Flavobacterium sp. ASW18X TaxID=2572595 RepID=UPI0010AE081A|nr:four helix bundle protein [Flavobacterium sp. ASW18X]TKD61005.1 four helix bundle protein [Flavobacterium sp. ASW18X]
MYNYRDLIVWQKAMNLVETTYRITSDFPTEEKYGIVSQIRRSAVSIPSNIAEGAGRNSKKSFRSFLEITNGSINELKTQLEISNRIGYLDNEVLTTLFDNCDEVQKITVALIKKYSTS